MKSVYNYIIKPKGQRYNNSVDVGEKSLILNTEIYNHQFVNREQGWEKIETSGKKQ